MSDEADSEREYERLRAELAEFVLGVLSERIATGKEPELSQALVDAIDRRVDAAVDERLGKLGPADATRSAATRRAPTRRSEPEPSNRGRLIVIGVVGVAILAALAFIVIRYLPAGPTNTTTRNVAGNDTTVIVENGQIVPPANGQGNLVVPPAQPATPPQ